MNDLSVIVDKVEPFTQQVIQEALVHVQVNAWVTLIVGVIFFVLSFVVYLGSKKLNKNNDAELTVITYVVTFLLVFVTCLCVYSGIMKLVYPNFYAIKMLIGGQ